MRKGRSRDAYWRAVLVDLGYDPRWRLECWNCMKVREAEQRREKGPP